jgi:spore coat protein U-like protein
MKMFSHSIIAAISGVFSCVCGFMSAAHSQSCTLSVTNVAFGSVDVTANAAVDTTATFSINCGTFLLGGSVCLNLGAGGGGATNAANRFMKSGANSLTYGLFSDAARTIPWGSNLWVGGGAPSVIINFGILGGGPATRTIFGRVFSGQQTVPAGSYLSAFSGMDASITVNCSGPATTTTSNVTATVPKTCSVTANDLNFGTAGTLPANTDASTTLSPTCTSGTAYNIGLNGGLSGAINPTQRKMTKGAEFVLYGLYRDSARSLPWGNTIGTNTLTGTGTGLAQSATVYGRIAPQATPSPGTYNDTIVVTLTY